MTRESRSGNAPQFAEWSQACAGTPAAAQRTRRAGATRSRRSAQLPLCIEPKKTKAAPQASDAELRELLARLPLREEQMTCRRDQRAKRTAHANRWVEWQGAELHATADGRRALELLRLQQRGTGT